MARTRYFPPVTRRVSDAFEYIDLEVVDSSPNMQINLTIKGEICIYTDLYTVAFTPLDFLIATNGIVRCIAIRIRPATRKLLPIPLYPTFTLFLYLSFPPPLHCLSFFLSFFLSFSPRFRFRNET